MLNFITKQQIWEAVDNGLQEHIDAKISYQLKIAQDLSVLSLLHGCENKSIAEIGGGDSRVLAYLAASNQCFNIEKFEGKHVGPGKEIKIDHVENIHAYIGDFDPLVGDGKFDVIFSISVVEHVENKNLDNFFEDSLRVLKTGGMFIHAIDLYLGDTPDDYHQGRLERYRTWVQDSQFVQPLGDIYQGDAIFSAEMASNPDNILYSWNSLVPTLAELRAKSQSVSLIVAGKKQ